MPPQGSGPTPCQQPLMQNIRRVLSMKPCTSPPPTPPVVAHHWARRVVLPYCEPWCLVPRAYARTIPYIQPPSDSLGPGDIPPKPRGMVPNSNP